MRRPGDRELRSERSTAAGDYAADAPPCAHPMGLNSAHPVTPHWPNSCRPRSVIGGARRFVGSVLTRPAAGSLTTLMYATCTFCYAALGTNEVIETFSVSRRVAFDPAKGCLWAICPVCARWNLAPLEERWEAVEECERRFRATALRYTSGNIGLASLHDDVELIRVGPALRPEVAAWRYGRILIKPRPVATRLLDRVVGVTARAVDAVTTSRQAVRRDARAAVSRLLVKLRGSRVLDVVRFPTLGTDDATLAVVRFSHLAQAALVRPEPGRPWSLHIPHDHGVLTIEGDDGVRTAARLLAIINRTGHAGGFSRELLESAVLDLPRSLLADA